MMPFKPVCHPCHMKCCTMEPSFLICLLGIGGLFAVLWLFFYNSPGTLTQFTGSNGDKYTFTASGSDITIYQNGTLISSIVASLDTAAHAQDLAKATCSGTTSLWTILAIGLFGILALIWFFHSCPDDFIHCSLRRPFEEMQHKYGPYEPAHMMTVAVPPAPIEKTAPVTTTPTTSTTTTAPSVNPFK